MSSVELSACSWVWNFNNEWKWFVKSPSVSVSGSECGVITFWFWLMMKPVTLTSLLSATLQCRATAKMCKGVSGCSQRWILSNKLLKRSDKELGVKPARQCVVSTVVTSQWSRHTFFLQIKWDVKAYPGFLIYCSQIRACRLYPASAWQKFAQIWRAEKLAQRLARCQLENGNNRTIMSWIIFLNSTQAGSLAEMNFVR